MPRRSFLPGSPRWVSRQPFTVAKSDGDFEGRWRTEWGEFSYRVDQLYDLGDRVLMVGRMVGTGSSSGAMFDNEWADLLTIFAGQVVREQVFLDHAEAFAFAGLDGSTP